MESDIELNCCVCGKSFFRLAKEHRRNVKRGRKVYCTISCSIKDRPKIRSNWNNPELIEKHLKPNWGKSHADEFSPFRYFVNKARSKGRKTHYGETDLTVEYLKGLWDSQKGICPYTGLTMELPTTTRGKHIKAKSPKHSSLDRIDSSKGYMEGNVEFVCLGVNYAKNSFRKEMMLDFFSQIRDTPP